MKTEQGRHEIALQWRRLRSSVKQTKQASPLGMADSLHADFARDRLGVQNDDDIEPLELNG
jgi:hypothetical protein